MISQFQGSRFGLLSIVRTPLLAVGFFSLFINALVLTVPLYMLQVFDRVLSSRSYETLIFLTIAAVGILIFLGFLEAVRGRILVRSGMRVETQLAEPVIRAELKAAAQGVSRPTHGLRDLHEIRAFVTGPALLMIFDSPWVPVYVAVIYLFHPLLGAVAAVGAVILFAIALLNDLLSRRRLDEAQRAGARSTSHVAAAAANSDVVEAMGMMPALLQRWRREALASLSPFAVAADRMSLVVASAKSIRLILQIAIMGVGVGLVLDRQITPGVMIAASILLGRALHPVEAAIGSWKTLLSASAALKRLNELLATEWGRSRAISLPKPEGRLSLKGVAYALPGMASPFIRGVEFNLEAGQSLGIVGSSGAGKTTLARLITGILTPQVGAVRLDEADVGTWRSEDRGRYVGYLPQDPQLFPGTVWENIARMDQHAESEDVIRAARRAYIHSMILRLPQGYETQIGDGGVQLSAGQRRLIALARCLYGDPRLLVLDEPGANLDPDGEEALQRALALATADGLTLVIISHQPRVLARVDRILVMENGLPKMLGPREEVFHRIMGPRDEKKVAALKAAKGKGELPKSTEGADTDLKEQAQ